MHKEVLLVGSLMLLGAASTTATATDTGQIKLTTPVIGPYASGEADKSVDFQYKYVGTSKAYMTETIRFYNASTEALLYSQTFSKHVVTSGQYHTFTVPFKTKSYFPSDGWKITIQVKSGSTEVYFQEMNLYPKNYKGSYGETFKIIKDNITKIETESTSVKITNNTLNKYNEQFTFTNFSPFITAKNFYQLNVKIDGFKYNKASLTYDKAYLTFYDYDNVFRFLRHDIDQSIQVPLEIYTETNLRYFKYKDTMYVDRNTLEPSLDYREGFSTTDYFFLPINSRESIEGKNFKLCVDGIGSKKYNFVFDLEYNSDKGIMGNCIDNDYCIVGEIE